MGFIAVLLGTGIFLIIMGIVVYYAFESDGGMLIGGIGGLLLIIVLVVAVAYYQAKREAQIINAQFGTSYTAEEMFWTGGIVKQNIEGLKIRIKEE